MSRNVTFVHLTDLHIGDPGNDSHLYGDTAATLRDILGQIATIDPAPDFLIASGDLTNRGDAESYAQMRRIMEGTRLPVVYALGNHDTREGFYAGSGLVPATADAPYDHDCVLAGIHVITLDSSTPGFIGGSLTPEQFEWLEAVLDTHPEAPKLIVSHHPPALGEEPDDTHWRHIEFGQSQRLAGILRGRNVLGILSGHIHHDRVAFWHGVPVIVGNGQHCATDTLRTDVLRMVRGTSFAIGTIRPGGLSVTFIPQPSDRAELKVYPLAALRERAGPVPAAAE